MSWKAQPAVPALVQALQDQSAAVREASARSLGKIGAPAKPAIPELVRLAQDKDNSVRAAAAEALQRIEPAVSSGKAGGLN
jgi:HEAT repeat protein